ncbi:MAG: hypothetical protein R2710_08740 [Acidimicrobiales bacterium]
MTTFEPPGAGQWDLDRSHYEGGITRISDRVMGDGARNAYRTLFTEMGMPADTMDIRSVNGFTYTRSARSSAPIETPDGRHRQS